MILGRPEKGLRPIPMQMTLRASPLRRGSNRSSQPCREQECSILPGAVTFYRPSWMDFQINWLQQDLLSAGLHDQTEEQQRQAPHRSKLVRAVFKRSTLCNCHCHPRDARLCCFPAHHIPAPDVATGTAVAGISLRAPAHRGQS